MNLTCNRPHLPPGVFAWRQVQHMVPQQFPQWASYFSGNPEDYYRSASNLNNLTLVTRWAPRRQQCA